MASNNRNNRDDLLKAFVSRGKNRRKKAGPNFPAFPRGSQGQNATFTRLRTTPPNRGQEYVSQGRAVENAANAQRSAAERRQGERERSQAYYRSKLGYDKPGITVKSAKRKAKRAAKKVIPGY